MKLRNYLLLNAWSYGLVTLFMLALPFFVDPIDQTGMIMCGILVVVFGYKSYSCYRKYQHANNEDIAYAPPANASTDEQIDFYKKWLKILWIAIPILSIWTIVDINELEAGSTEYISVWAPVHFCYENGGYWLGILITPIIGVVLSLLMWRKIKSVRK